MNELLLRDDIEYIIHCDDRGDIIGPISKAHAHLPGVREILTHYSTWAMVYNPVLWKYGLQLKVVKKHDTFSEPKWDMGVAGHNCYMQTKNGYRPIDFEENLAKEADEEVGLDVKTFDSLDDFLIASLSSHKTIGYIFERFHHSDGVNNEWVGAGLILTTQETLEFKDGEVLEFQWLTPDELKVFLTNGRYHSALPIIFEKAEEFRLRYLIQ